MCTYGVVLFYTSSSVMRAEKTLMKENLTVKLIPTPRDLSSDCGTALRFDWEHVDRVEALLDTTRIEFDGIYQI